MNPPINFLPWRQQRRTAFLRFWLLMFVAPLLLAVGITLILRLTGSAEARIDAVLLQAEQQLARSLQITKPRLLEHKHYRVKRTRNVTPPGCIFSSQSAGSHAAGCAGTLAI